MRGNISKDQAEILYKEHSNYVYRIAFFLTGSKMLSEDVMQETFIKVLQKYSTFDSRKPIRPWIYSITINTVRNILRKHKWLSFVGEIPETNDFDFVEDTILQNEEGRELWREVNNLSLKSKEIIILHYYMEFKLIEIADILNIPLGTCKSRLNSALNSLKKRLPHNNFAMIDKGGEYYETI